LEEDKNCVEIKPKKELEEPKDVKLKGIKEEKEKQNKSVEGKNNLFQNYCK